MALNTDKIDDAALALLYLTLHDGYRAWKGMDWDVLGRLHDKGMIHDPQGEIRGVHGGRPAAVEGIVREDVRRRSLSRAVDRFAANRRMG
jgi:hypothetical protein